MRRSAAWSMARWYRTRPSRICSSGRLTWFATSPPSLPWTPVMSSPPEPWAGSATPGPRRATCRAARRWWQGSKASARRSARLDVDALAAAFGMLDAGHWATEVVTAKGRHVTAAALPWLRTREVWVHTADLHRAADFPDFPPPLLDELIVDVLRFRRDARDEALQ